MTRRDRPLRLVLLGDPVEHSRSPAMHRAALAALGIPGSYEARRVDEEGMTAAAVELRRGEIDGANITMPHKKVAAALADRLHPEAARAGSVNTWIRDGEELVGHSTDIAAVRKVWERRRLPSGPVLLLGSGGAAAAALVALEGRQVVVAARRKEAAESLVRVVGARAEVCGWEEARLRAVVVNATPLGMRGEDLPEWMLQQATGVFDMAYGWGETPVLGLARRRGLPAADGIDMLVAQAEESFRLWTGVSPPEGVMEEAARNPSRALSGAPTQPTRTEAQE